MVITKIERQKRNTRRVNLFIDGTFAFGIDEEVFRKFALRCGDEVSEPLYRSMLLSEEGARAKQEALRFLSYRMRTEREIRSRLVEKEYPPETINKVVESLKQLNAVNDRHFAEVYLRDLQLKKPSGKRLGTQKLRSMGIPAEIIEEAITSSTDQETEQARAFKAAEQVIKRFQSGLQGKDRLKEQRRFTSYLARRGFEWSVISTVVNKYFR